MFDGFNEFCERNERFGFGCFLIYVFVEETLICIHEFIERSYRSILAWVRLGGTLTLEKWILAPFYWVYFPHCIISKGPILKGLFLAVPKLYVEQLALSVALWLIYDIIGVDIIGLSLIKHQLNINGKRIRSRLPRWGRFLDAHRRSARFVEFLFLSWQLIAFLALLCMRIDGRKGDRRKELCMLCASVGVATVWWTIYTLFLYEPVMSLF